MEDKEVATFMGGVTTELKNVYRSLDEIREMVRENHRDSKETSDALRGIFEEYQKSCRQEDMSRDKCLENLVTWKKLVEDSEPKKAEVVEGMDQRLKKVEENQWKLGSLAAAGGAMIGILGREALRLFGK